MSLLDYGAGASEGLDRYLTRLMAQEQLAETARAHQAQEANVGRGLDQNEWLRQSLADERAAKTDAVTNAQTKEAERQTAEDQMLKDPEFAKTPQGQWLKLRRVEPNAPFQLFQPNMGRPAGPIEDTPGGMVRVGEDNKVSPILGADNQPVKKYHPPVQPVVVQTSDGPKLVNRGTGAASDITQGGSQVHRPLPAQEQVRVDTAPKMAAHIDPTKQEIETLDKEGQLGPAMGRWNDFLANKVGSTGDPDLDYRMGHLGFNLKGLISGFINIHAGARGAASANLSQMWQDILNSKNMSKERLFGALDAEKDWLNLYGTGPDNGQGKGQAGGTDAYAEYLARTKKP